MQPNMLSFLKRFRTVPIGKERRLNKKFTKSLSASAKSTLLALLSIISDNFSLVVSVASVVDMAMEMYNPELKDSLF